MALFLDAGLFYGGFAKPGKAMEYPYGDSGNARSRDYISRRHNLREGIYGWAYGWTIAI